MASDPLILAFDTSAAHCAAALLSGDRIVISTAEEMTRGQAERLMPLLQELLAEAGFTWQDLSALGVGVGPGNFTGIRIAVSAARGLALGLDVPAVGVSGCEARAYLAPVDTSITIADLHQNPYPIYRRLRTETPVVRVPTLGRIFLTKAVDIRAVKDAPLLFSSDGTKTPMERAFQAHTLMRKDGDDHQRDRRAMAPAFTARNMRDHWHETYTKIAHDYVDRLPRGETVDLFQDLAAPYAARCLTHLLGIESATDNQMIHWSQALIDGAGNFALDEKPFEVTDAAHDIMNALFEVETQRHHVEQGPSALSAMVNADDPIALSQIRANVKIAIGGGINEPRDALCTILFGLLSNPDHIAAVKDDPKWYAQAFEEAVRWVAPI